MTGAAQDPRDPAPVRFELPGGISLSAGAAPAARAADYPTSRIPKGLTLEADGIDLTDEGVGFGVPILTQQLETIFPVRVCFRRSPGHSARITAEFEMGLVGRLQVGRRRGGRRGRSPLSAASEVMARLHRGFPFLQKTMAAAAALIAGRLGVAPVYQQGPPHGTIVCLYDVDTSRRGLNVHVDARDARMEDCRALIIMNELGAGSFSTYQDSSPLELAGDDIESWSPVRAQRASFRDPATGASFTLSRRPGARLFRGREMVPGRLCWAGFAYVLGRGVTEFDYCITL